MSAAHPTPTFTTPLCAKQFMITTRKKLRKHKREKTIQYGGLGLMSKKEFRKTCMICLYEFQSEGNYQTDQLRHQQSFGDLDQPISCPICHER